MGSLHVEEVRTQTPTEGRSGEGGVGDPCSSPTVPPWAIGDVCSHLVAPRTLGGCTGMAYVWFWSPVLSCAEVQRAQLPVLHPSMPDSEVWPVQYGLIFTIPSRLCQTHLYSYAKILRVTYAATVWEFMAMKGKQHAWSYANWRRKVWDIFSFLKNLFIFNWRVIGLEY